LRCGDEILGCLPVRDVAELEFGVRRYRLVQDRVDITRLRSQVVAGAAPCRDEGAGVQVDACLPGDIGCLLQQLKRAVQMGEGLISAAGLSLGTGDAAMGQGLGVPVAQPARGLQGGALGAGPVVPLAAAVEEGLQAEGKLPGTGVEAVTGGQGDGRDQPAVLGVQPGQGLWVQQPVGRRRGAGSNRAGGLAPHGGPMRTPSWPPARWRRHAAGHGSRTAPGPVR
jgi:hypothetical protein